MCDSKEESTLPCSKCGQGLCPGTGKPGGNCVECESTEDVNNDMYTNSDLQVTPPVHNSRSLAQENDMTKKEKEVHRVDALIEELTASHSLLQEQARATISTLKQLLCQKEAELLASYGTTYSYKLNLLNHYKERLVSKPPSPLPHSFSGGLCCGFVPEVTNLVHSMACFMLEHRSEVEVGEEARVSVIGSLAEEGQFCVRILSDDSGLQDIMLQNLSNSIGVELSLSPFKSLESASVGDLCCALYSQDQRWYRARVISGQKKTARVYFLDYGNTEVISYSNLSKIHPKFLVYPFQMIQCCFSTDNNLVYEREVRWKFTDMTHGSNLSIKVLQRLPDSIQGRLHLVQLTNCSGAEPFDVGKSIVMMASLTPIQPSSIKYRDIRYAHTSGSNKQPPVTNTQSSATPTKQPQAPSPPEVTPTIIIETPPEKSKQEEEVVMSEKPPSDQPCLVVAPPDSGEPSQVLPHEGSDLFSVSDANTSCTVVMTSASDSVNTISSSSHTVGDIPALSTGMESSVELGQSGSSISIPTGKAELGGQMSPPVGDVAETVSVEVGAGLPTGSGGIASAAQIKNMEPDEAAVAHSPVPIPAVTADAGSRSHSPIPISVSVNQTSEIDTRIKSVSDGGIPPSDGHFSLKKGAELQVYVTTPLSLSGLFWVQLASAEHAEEFQSMVEELQRCCREEPPTPVFFSQGDVCAAQFSEDECWYRARVEKIVKSEFLMRYLDFGNGECRPKDFLVALKSKFRIIPFQAFQSSIACPDHTSFSDKEIEHFEKLTEGQKLTARILSVDEQMASVQLYLNLPSGAIDLNEEVYTADKIGETLSFTLRSTQQGKAHSSPPETEAPLSLSALKKMVEGGSSWADFMDDLQSPHNDGIFTLAGQDSSGSRSGSHTPTPSPSQQPPRSTPPPGPPQARPHSHAPRSREHSSQRERERARNSSPRNRTPTCTSSQSNSSVGRSGSVPRIQTDALGMVRKNLLIAEKSRKERAKSDQPQLHNHQMITKLSTNTAAGTNVRTSPSPSHSPTPTPSPLVPPGLPQPKGIRSINQVSRNGTAFPPTGRRRKSPEPDSAQVKLFVRYMPHNKSMEEIYHLFALYGQIHTLEYHTEHKDKLYLIMDKEGGMRAIEGLNGNQLTGSPKPLSVQPYKVSSVQSSEQADYDCLPSNVCTRLFVKNIPLNRSMEDVKTMFSHYGKVIGVVPVPSRKNVVYMYMDPEGAKLAMDELHGKAVAKYCKPLMVEISQPSRRNRS